MSNNQFRRDPVTGIWSIIIEDEYDVSDLIGHTHVRPGAGSAAKPGMYDTGREAKTAPEIFAIRNDGSQANQPGWTVRVLPMAQPFLQIFGDLNSRGVGLYDVLDGIGAHELVIESPTSGPQMHEMELQQIQDVLLAYRARILDLKRDTRFRYVMVHKNYGEGADDLRFHSHSHIIATPITPARVKIELMNQMEHFKFKERCLFCDIIFQELNDNERIIYQNDKFVVLSPFASRAPFSVWILPKTHETFFEWNNDYRQLAEAVKEILVRINSVLQDPNFVMVLHTGPNMATGADRGYWQTLEKDYHWYIEITPRFRTFTSFEIGSGFQVNVVSPERATQILNTGHLS